MEIDNLQSSPFTETPQGFATIETYSIVFGRSNEPEFGIVIGRLGEIDDSEATRFIANLPNDTTLLADMTQTECVNTQGSVRQQDHKKFLPA